MRLLPPPLFGADLLSPRLIEVADIRLQELNLSPFFRRRIADAVKVARTFKDSDSRTAISDSSAASLCLPVIPISSASSSR